MSDNWITLIAEDPGHVPGRSARTRARDRFAEIAPCADEIDCTLTQDVLFFDCGANFERIRCPSCGTELSVGWWQERMDDDYDGRGFRLAQYRVPCCGVKQTLHQLAYDFPQGFARFALQAMNPDIGELNDEQRLEFEAILDTRLRVIYQHI